MSKERKKANLKDYMEFYSELIDTDDNKEILGKLEESKTHLINLQNFMKSTTHFGRSVLNLLLESMRPGTILDTGSDILNLLHLAVFYSSLLDSFVKDANRKISYLKKSRNIKSMTKQQYLLDELGILRISSLVLRDMSGFHQKFKEFVKKTNFDESFPKYEELMELKEELEKMEEELEKKNKFFTRKLYELKI